MSTTLPKSPPARLGVLGIHSGALGDVILFAQLLASMRREGKGLGLVAGESKAALLWALGVVDWWRGFESVPIHEAFMDSGAAAGGGLARALPRCEHLVSCFGTGDPRVEVRLAEACGASRSTFLPVRPAASDRRHLVDVWAEAAGIPGVPAPFWPPPAAMLEEGRDELGRLGVDASRPFALLHVGAGAVDKCWPLPSFEALAERLPYPCVFVLGPAELERGPACHAHRCLVAPSLTCLAGAASLAGLFVGGDSGPTHLAAAVGAPTVAVFGPSDPVHFSPRGRLVRVVGGGRLPEAGVEAVAAAITAILP